MQFFPERLGVYTVRDADASRASDSRQTCERITNKDDKVYTEVNTKNINKRKQAEYKVSSRRAVFGKMERVSPCWVRINDETEQDYRRK